jgi:hypothetical protein
VKERERERDREREESRERHTHTHTDREGACDSEGNRGKVEGVQGERRTGSSAPHGHEGVPHAIPALK